MSNSSKFVLQSFRSIQRLSRQPCELSSRFCVILSQLPSTRTFHSQSFHLAQAATTPSATSSTAAAAGTEASLKPETPLPTIELDEKDPTRVDWSRSFHGLGNQAFPKEAANILLAPLDHDIIEIKPDGIIYLPEIHYRRILNRAFGPGAWGLAPRGETIVTDKAVTREYALVAHGRLVSIARGEQDYFSKDGIPTASEGCKSNALVRCCKDLGIASELWDPRFIKQWKAKNTKEVFVEHQVTKKRTKLTLRKDDKVGYPWKETNGAAPAVRKTASGPGSNGPEY